MNTKTPDTDLLAIKFIAALREMVDDTTIREINRLNGTAAYDGICASHDFCDPNQAMVHALEALGFDFHPSLNEFVNEAWAKAKAAGFSLKLTSKKVAKLATIQREFLSCYESDLTYVVLSETHDMAEIKPLNFPDRDVMSVPAHHLKVFDEIETGDD